jgi:hypothetical protein
MKDPNFDKKSRNSQVLLTSVFVLPLKGTMRIFVATLMAMGLVRSGIRSFTLHPSLRHFVPLSLIP